MGLGFWFRVTWFWVLVLGHLKSLGFWISGLGFMVFGFAFGRMLWFWLGFGAGLEWYLLKGSLGRFHRILWHFVGSNMVILLEH